MLLGSPGGELSWSVESIGEEIREHMIFFRKRYTVPSQFWGVDIVFFLGSWMKGREKRNTLAQSSKSTSLVEKVFRILLVLLAYPDFEEKTGKISWKFKFLTGCINLSHSVSSLMWVVSTRSLVHTFSSMTINMLLIALPEQRILMSSQSKEQLV